MCVRLCRRCSACCSAGGRVCKRVKNCAPTAQTLCASCAHTDTGSDERGPHSDGGRRGRAKLGAAQRLRVCCLDRPAHEHCEPTHHDGCRAASPVRPTSSLPSVLGQRRFVGECHEGSPLRGLQMQRPSVLARVVRVSQLWLTHRVEVQWARSAVGLVDLVEMNTE